MTVLTARFHNVAGEPTDGEICLSAVHWRPSSQGEVAVTREIYRGKLEDGAFRSPDLEPGPVRVEVTANGVFETWDVNLPEKGEHSLVSLIDTQYEWSPAVVGRAQAAASKAQSAADRAERIVAVLGSAEKLIATEMKVEQINGDVLAALQDARDARDAAGRHATNADASRLKAENAAGQAADNARNALSGEIASAKEQAERAAQSARDASGQATAAEGSAKRVEARITTVAGQLRDEVSASMAQAAQSATNAEGAASTAGLAAKRAESQAQDAGRSAGSASTALAAVQSVAAEVNDAAGRAQAAEESASTHESKAGMSSRQAEISAQEARQAAASAKVGAPEGGWPRNTLSEDVRDSLDRGDAALQSVPRATGDNPGGVKLAGDLGGTWDMPTVPGLASKMDKMPVSDGTAANTLVKRTSSGHIVSPDPTTGNHVASKTYVDTQDGKKADKSHTHTSADITDKVWQVTPNASQPVIHADSQGRVYLMDGAEIYAWRGGRFVFSGTPQRGIDVPNKSYVDDAISKASPATTTSVRSADAGKQLTTRKVVDGSNVDSYLDVQDGGTVWVRDGGRIYLDAADGMYIAKSPTKSTDPVRKSYVDAATQASSWSYGGVTVRDNGTINLGTGGALTSQWRVDRGMFQCYVDIKWGRNPSSGGGPLKVRLPKINKARTTVYGYGAYWSEGDKFLMTLACEMKPNSQEGLLMVTRHGSATFLDAFQIWDGKNGSGTGHPANPGFVIDESGSGISFSISYPSS